MVRILLMIGILQMFVTIIIHASERRSITKSDRIIEYLCEKLYEIDNNLRSDENRQWDILCQKWIQRQAERLSQIIEDKQIIDEENMVNSFQLRKGRGGGGGGRFSGGSRFSSGSRSSSSGSSRSGSRSSFSATSFRNIRSGHRIVRPSGWQWSRTRSTFLLISLRFGHRYRSSSNRYTTPAPNSNIYYYYCTSNNNASAEIQCSTINGDTLCFEEVASGQPFCCGGKISEDFIEDTNRAGKLLAKIFYTLAAVTLSVHIFMRRFHQ